MTVFNKLKGMKKKERENKLKDTREREREREGAPLPLCYRRETEGRDRQRRQRDSERESSFKTCGDWKELPARTNLLRFHHLTYCFFFLLFFFYPCTPTYRVCHPYWVFPILSAYRVCHHCMYTYWVFRHSLLSCRSRCFSSWLALPWGTYQCYQHSWKS